MSGFLQPTVYGTLGVSSDAQNAMVFAAQFVNANRAQLEALLKPPSVTRQWHAMRVVGSTQVASNTWEYTLRKAQPDSNPLITVDSEQTELLEVVAYNLAEYGNTAAIAGGGVDATRANNLGFELLPVPDDAFVHAFVMYQADGRSVALFERMNIYDGECEQGGFTVVDGGTY